jgi:MFS family permease
MEGTRDLGVAAPSSAGYQRRWWALAVLCPSLVVLAMDNTILNVTLPTLARELGATGSELQWMVDAYLLVFAGLLLTMGAVGDRFGRKLALNAGLVVFVAASAASAFAGSPEVLIASRAVMGIGAALIMPSTLSIITNIFPPTERGRAIGVWAGVAGLGVVLGPVSAAGCWRASGGVRCSWSTCRWWPWPSWPAGPWCRSLAISAPRRWTRSGQLCRWRPWWRWSMGSSRRRRPGGPIL